jgi:hypothetical protein
MLTPLFLPLFPSPYHFHLECQCTVKHTTTHIHKENIKNLPNTSTKATPQQTPRTRHSEAEIPPSRDSVNFLPA